MVLSFLLLILTILFCWLLPFFGTIVSTADSQKWVGYWLLTLFFSYTLFPLLGYLIDTNYVSITHILISILMMIFFSPEKAKLIQSFVEGIVVEVDQVCVKCKESIKDVSKKYEVTK